MARYYPIYCILFYLITPTDCFLQQKNHTVTHVTWKEAYTCSRPMSYRHFLSDERFAKYSTRPQQEQCHTMLICSGGDATFSSVGSLVYRFRGDTFIHDSHICYNELHLQIYNFSQSTEQNYHQRTMARHNTIRNNNNNNHHLFPYHHSPSPSLLLFGPFVESRRQIDYAYHSYYRKTRQQFQDSIIESSLRISTVQTSHPPTSTYSTKTTPPQQPWIVFTAGSMGSGKSYTIRYLQSRGYFPRNFITIDPDEIRHCLPEFYLYLQSYTFASYAGEMTRKEAGYIAEIITLEALKHGYSVLVDGTLRDTEWYSFYFDTLKQHFQQQQQQKQQDQHPSSLLRLRIAIIHITAPTLMILQRTTHRAKKTGRIIPDDILLHSVETVPQSVRILSSKVDFFIELYNPTNNPSDISIVTPNMTWSLFQDVWR